MLSIQFQLLRQMLMDQKLQLLQIIIWLLMIPYTYMILTIIMDITIESVLLMAQISLYLKHFLVMMPKELLL